MSPAQPTTDSDWQAESSSFLDGLHKAAAEREKKETRLFLVEQINAPRQGWKVTEGDLIVQAGYTTPLLMPLPWPSCVVTAETPEEALAAGRLLLAAAAKSAGG